ncbi:hypothetical protein FRX31_031722 [Thalictrum thalictroides]|uniref:Uncharacterized protein n=1 Tax=Thalictrum thalictroides TaxID=46969 RepID=A0A7J6V156_THATH|nr:hypothetical protein FRX31_031722 [Thalictrum thalictroides]
MDAPLPAGLPPRPPFSIPAPGCIRMPPSQTAAYGTQAFTIGSKIVKQNLELVNLILQILVLTLGISQERNFNQPHFTLSNDGLFQLYGVVDDGSNSTGSSSSAELVLRAILTSPLPASVSQMLNTIVALIIGVALKFGSQERLLWDLLFKPDSFVVLMQPGLYVHHSPNPLSVSILAKSLCCVELLVEARADPDTYDPTITNEALKHHPLAVQQEHQRQCCYDTSSLPILHFHQNAAHHKSEL